MVKKETPKKYVGITDILKAKLIEAGTEYFHENIDRTKNQVFNYVEKNIERIIKKEVKKNLTKLTAYFLLGIGGLFLLYGILGIIVELLFLPNYSTNIFFGLVILIIGFILWLN